MRRRTRACTHSAKNFTLWTILFVAVVRRSCVYIDSIPLGMLFSTRPPALHSRRHTPNKEKASRILDSIMEL